MKRLIFNILSAVSLLLCVATVLLWVRSYWIGDSLAYGRGLQVYTLASVQGRACLTIAHFQTTPPLEMVQRPGWTWETLPAWHTALIFMLPGWRSLGFGVNDIGDGVNRTVVAVYIPQWFVFGLSAVLPILWLRSWRRVRLARRKDLRHQCGYDLRASKDRCPECRTPVFTKEA